METIYIGVDFHARQQTICYLKTETGELVFHELKHQDKPKVRAFYAQFPRARDRRVGSQWLQPLVRTTARGTGLRSLAGACHRDPSSRSWAAEARSARRRAPLGSGAR